MIVAAIGELSSQLTISEHEQTRLRNIAYDALKDLKPNKILIRMVIGWDMAVAEAAILLKIPMHVVLSTKKEYRKWPRYLRGFYKYIIRSAERVMVLGESDTPILRDRWILNNATTFLTMSSGKSMITEQMVAYARSCSKSVINLYVKLSRSDAMFTGPMEYANVSSQCVSVTRHTDSRVRVEKYHLLVPKHDLLSRYPYRITPGLFERIYHDRVLSRLDPKEVYKDLIRRYGTGLTIVDFGFKGCISERTVIAKWLGSANSTIISER